MVLGLQRLGSQLVDCFQSLHVQSPPKVFRKHFLNQVDLPAKTATYLSFLQPVFDSRLNKVDFLQTKVSGVASAASKCSTFRPHDKHEASSSAINMASDS